MRSQELTFPTWRTIAIFLSGVFAATVVASFSVGQHYERVEASLRANDLAHAEIKRSIGEIDGNVRKLLEQHPGLTGVQRTSGGLVPIKDDSVPE